MESKLFAFRLARPIETVGGTPLEFIYDPATQTAAWTGSGTAIASLYCTNKGGTRHYSFCNGYGNYCTAYNRNGKGGPYTCD